MRNGQKVYILTAASGSEKGLRRATAAASWFEIIYTGKFGGNC